jgi:hypothetical protein
MQVYALIDPEASNSFVACRIVNNLHVLLSKLGVGVMVNTPLGENIDIDDIYKGLKLYIGGLELRVDLMLLELNDFDLITGMDYVTTQLFQGQN